MKRMATDEPRVLVFPNKGKIVSLYSVWIYPYEMLEKGARVAFFRAEVEQKVLCYMYLPQELSGDLKGEAYSKGLNAVCDIARAALLNHGFDLGDDFDLHVDVGDLDIADFAE